MIPKALFHFTFTQVDQKQKRVVTREKGEEWARQNKMGWDELADLDQLSLYFLKHYQLGSYF